MLWNEITAQQPEHDMFFNRPHELGRAEIRVVLFLRGGVRTDSWINANLNSFKSLLQAIFARPICPLERGWNKYRLCIASLTFQEKSLQEEAPTVPLISGD